MFDIKGLFDRPARLNAWSLTWMNPLGQKLSAIWEFEMRLLSPGVIVHYNCLTVFSNHLESSRQNERAALFFSIQIERKDI